MKDARLTKVEAQLAEMQQDHDMVLLRQMAWQAESKLARFTMPFLTPKMASHMTFSLLSKQERLDKAVFQQVVAKHPGLKGGLEVLKELGPRCAHPELARVSDGSKQPVTSKLLKDLVAREFCDGDPTKPDVEAVLACLEYLAQQLDEGLFLSTM